MSLVPGIPDPLAKTLEEIRERSERPVAGHLPISNDAVRGLMESAADVPRLLAAVEAVLVLTRDSDGNDRHPSRMLRAGDVREAIARELAGQE